MEFKSLKNIESSFRQIRLFSMVFLSLCALVVVYSVWSSYRFAERQREKIYVLDGGKSLMLALSQDLTQNRPAEAREHVRRFHELFFTLSPEKSAIEHNIKRALLLADKSVYNYYSDFSEKGYYNRIIAGNINQVLQVDSVVCDFDRYPYRVNTYARQMIIRESNVTQRSLVTSCRLLNASRSDDNPNGFTIEGFTILETATYKHWTDRPMRKLIERLNEWTERQDERLRVWLTVLPERTKIIVVLVIFSLFAIGALFTFRGGALPNRTGKRTTDRDRTYRAIQPAAEAGQYPPFQPLRLWHRTKIPRLT